VPLRGLGTSGYGWHHEIDGPPGVVEVEWKRGFPPGSAEQPVGVSAPEVATIHAVAPGMVTLRLVQRRSWESGVPPRESHTVSVRVS
jgi:predicted secreted protein